MPIVENWRGSVLTAPAERKSIFMLVAETKMSSFESRRTRRGIMVTSLVSKELYLFYCNSIDTTIQTIYINYIKLDAYLNGLFWKETPVIIRCIMRFLYRSRHSLLFLQNFHNTQLLQITVHKLSRPMSMSHLCNVPFII